MAKVNKKIINQNPKVNIDKNAKNPKYWSKSNMVYAFVLRYKYTIRKIVLQHKILDLSTAWELHWIEIKKL